MNKCNCLYGKMDLKNPTINMRQAEDGTWHSLGCTVFRKPRPSPTGPRMFRMIRVQDESGVSGTGLVLEGAVFGDGVTVIRWTVPDKPNSTAIYESYEAFKLIHIDSHPTNETKIYWRSWKYTKEGDIDV